MLGGTPLRHPPTRLAGIDPTARIHPSATIAGPVKIGAGAVVGAGVTIGPNAILGDGAIVRASVANTVVWAGAVVETRPEEAIITGTLPATTEASRQ